MKIPVSRAAWYGAEQRTQWGTGPLPTAYPWSNAYVTLTDAERVLSANTMPGSQSMDPRASLGFGTANYVVVPSNEEMFNRITSVGGDYYGGIFTGRNVMGWVVGAVIAFFVWKFIKRG